MLRRLDLLYQDAEEQAEGRDIRNVSRTNTITTAYENRCGREERMRRPMVLEDAHDA